ncbi:hypothetical protein [Nocardioides salarius]|jgi:hypothetical protein|nr:hypothetical protein [Nocardioides salarius]MBM7509711.1 hypothetical protein [Nocardioides salarius]
MPSELVVILQALVKAQGTPGVESGGWGVADIRSWLVTLLVLGLLAVVAWWARGRR